MDRPVLGAVFAPQLRSTWCIDGGGSGIVAVPTGSVCLYTVPQIWWRWEQPADTVHLALDPILMAQIAIDCGMGETATLDHRLVLDDPVLFHLAVLFKTELQTGGIGGSLYIESLTTALMIHLLRHYRGSSTKLAIDDRPLDAHQINQIRAFIETHLSEDFTVADLAALAHFSPAHFARSFKATIGLPPHRYVMQQRIEKAKQLLVKTRLPIAEVALSVGFTNKSHFAAQFHKSVGASPKAYRDSC
ncbi:transcriptional regulator, AraC family [Leptolyngbya sp. NIES-2104]|nr:transcriptional regulator, AraC family [Leptolyngbya sp. NIES-2104]